MGPKKKSAGGGGKKKPSKAERLRMQREEEERRLLEEQEARLRAELEEAARREMERNEREKMEQLEAKDNERRGIELAELSVLEESFMKASQWKADLRVSAKWKHYTGCDGTPDPTVPQEINTFMSLWQEDKNSDIQDVIEKGNGVLELIQKLQFCIMDTPYEELRVDDVIQHQITIQKLQALLHQKYNNATEQLLKQAHSYAESESGNMEVVIKATNITLCLWANLKKNPRFRNQIFRDEERNPTNGFELPKPLTICDIAVRIMHTHYDHLSPVLLFPSKPANLGFQPVLPPPAVTVEAEEEEEEAPKVAEETGLEIQPEQSAPLVQIPSNILSSHEMKNTEAGEIPAEVDNEKADPSCCIFRAQVSTVEVPETREEPPPEDCIVDLEQFMPVGGVYYFDCLKLPPQAKQMRGWTMVQVLDTGLENYLYSAACEETEDPSLYIVGLTLQLLDSIVLFEEPLIGRWDPAGRYWRTDSVGDVVYNIHEKEVSFKMSCFSTVTLLQDAHINMPYMSWELQPQGPDQAILTVVTNFAEVNIHIKNEQCMVISVSTMEEKDLLSYLRDKWMTPLALTIALKQAGMNIFPTECSEKFVCINKKSSEAEFIGYQQMALVASAFAFSWSKWNKECGEDQVVFKACEHMDEEPIEKGWAVYMFNGKRAQKLKITEKSKAFSRTIAEQSEFHSTLFHLLKDKASEAAMERVKSAHYLFIDSVYQLLVATRLLTYA